MGENSIDLIPLIGLKSTLYAISWPAANTWDEIAVAAKVAQPITKHRVILFVRIGSSSIFSILWFVVTGYTA